MNHVLIVSYDLVNPGQNYELLLQAIKSFGGWARLGGSAYLIATSLTPVEVRDRLVPLLAWDDHLFVGMATAPSAWRGLPDDVSNWILQNQKQ